MENSFGNNFPKKNLIQFSQEEIDIINNIRGLDFGRVTISIQNGTIVSKEITKIVKNHRNKNKESRL